jgi:hypothetical protein
MKNEKQNMTESDLTRIEKKLDAIIQYFNIGELPRRSDAKLDELAKASVLKFREKLKKEKSHGCKGADTG